MTVMRDLMVVGGQRPAVVAAKRWLDWQVRKAVHNAATTQGVKDSSGADVALQ
jgi:hypothetical protein